MENIKVKRHLIFILLLFVSFQLFSQEHTNNIDSNFHGGITAIYTQSFSRVSSFLLNDNGFGFYLSLGDQLNGFETSRRAKSQGRYYKDSGRVIFSSDFNRPFDMSYSTISAPVYDATEHFIDNKLYTGGITLNLLPFMWITAGVQMALSTRYYHIDYLYTSTLYPYGTFLGHGYYFTDADYSGVFNWGFEFGLVFRNPNNRILSNVMLGYIPDTGKLNFGAGVGLILR